MECQYCKKILSSISSLNQHQKRTKSCLKLQGKNIEEGSFLCSYCKKAFFNKHHLISHSNICQSNSVLVQELRDKIEKYETRVMFLQQEVTTLKKDKTTLQESYNTLATTCAQNSSILDEPVHESQEETDIKSRKIKYLTDKYVKARPRKQYNDKYVIYILTTKLMKTQNRYILGKATNLTNRLSTYNKSDEHEVVYYKSCGNKETMSCVEKMVFHALRLYREQANRERFVLPMDEEIALFSDVIKNSINYLLK